MVAVRIQDAEQDQRQPRHHARENGKRWDGPGVWGVLQAIHAWGVTREVDGADCGGEEDGGQDAADAEYGLEGEGADIWDEPEGLVGGGFRGWGLTWRFRGDLRDIGVTLVGVLG